MVGLFRKSRPTIESILTEAAQKLEVEAAQYVRIHSDFAIALYNVRPNHAEVSLFAASVVVIIGQMHAQGSDTEKQTAIASFINKYLGSVAERLGKTRIEVSVPYPERESTYRSILDRCFALRDPTGPADLAKTLYSDVFGPKNEPGEAIGPALAGFIYALVIETKQKLQPGK
jgi:hypothetical protein